MTHQYEVESMADSGYVMSLADAHWQEDRLGLIPRRCYYTNK